MARKPTPPRVIPNFALDKPWSDPTTVEEQEGLASLAVMSGAGDGNRNVSDFIKGLDNQAYQQMVRAARANTQGGGR